MKNDADVLRGQILDLVRKYWAAAFPNKEFIPGQTPVPYAGRVFDSDEIASLVDSSLDFWLTTGRFADQFEKEFARFKHAQQNIIGTEGDAILVSRDGDVCGTGSSVLIWVASQH